MSRRLETSMDISTLNTATQSESYLNKSTLEMETTTSKLSSSSSSFISNITTVRDHGRLPQSKSSTSILEYASSERPKEITEFPTTVKPSTSSSTSPSSDKTEQNNHWMLIALILIALIAAAFVGGVFNALKPKCRMPVVCNARSSSQDHTNVNDQKMNKNIQQRDTPRTYDEETQDYDEIQKSQLNQQLNPVQCTSIEFRRENAESELRSSNSQKQSMYKRISFNCDYNILLLKQRQSAAIYDHDWRSNGAILGTDEEFVTLPGGESLNLPGTAEDNIFQTLTRNFDFSRIKGEERLDCSLGLIRSTSESQLSEFKFAPNLREYGFDNLSNEEGLYCEKEYIEVAKRIYTTSVQISEIEEFKPEMEITRF
ncbi:uncharacterized protein LOC134249901 [Saccostrea cucullata]|uniref:uncharacterized protein LOC134249901 n=1 Tax=Saccostrea cuccullata TaxID=36930 RepID=UPI002ED55A93